MFKGLGNLANIASMMKQAQSVGAKMQELTEQLKRERVTGSAGGGLVTVECNGAGEVLSVRIDPSLQDMEMLQDLLPAAINDGLNKGRELHAQAMQEITGGMNLPGLSDMLGDSGSKGS